MYMLIVRWGPVLYGARLFLIFTGFPLDFRGSHCLILKCLGGYGNPHPSIIFVRVNVLGIPVPAHFIGPALQFLPCCTAVLLQ